LSGICNACAVFVAFKQLTDCVGGKPMLAPVLMTRS
jgi:hypothetical protein